VFPSTRIIVRRNQNATKSAQLTATGGQLREDQGSRRCAKNVTNSAWVCRDCAWVRLGSRAMEYSNSHGIFCYFAGAYCLSISL
jgi:hypothetical protein